MPAALAATAAGALLGALAALMLYHRLSVRPALERVRSMVHAHDAILGGGAGEAAGRLARLESDGARAGSESAALAERVGVLEALAQADVSRVGFVRFNAHDDTGSDLSYALALLNRRGDGVVLSSLYSRADTRTYGKAVNAFAPAANASAEELQAIERARGEIQSQ